MDDEALKVLTPSFTPPAIVYQYVRSDGANILAGKRIMTSSPRSLNDPFEWSPRVEPHVTPDQIFEGQKRIGLDPQRFIVARMMENRDVAAKKHREGFAETFEEHFQIVCLSESLRGVLMWAHYAESHKGFLVGFDGWKLRTEYEGSPLLKVAYDNVRPTVPHPYHRPATPAEMTHAFSVKSPEWVYEEEWRLLIATRHLVMEDTPKGPRHFLPYRGELVKTVVFGSRTDDSLKQRLLQICASDPDLKHVKFYQAGLHQDYFSIVTEPVG